MCCITCCWLAIYSEQCQSGDTGVVALQAADVKAIAEALNVHVHAVLKPDTSR